VTVVATGYGEPRPASRPAERERSRFEEPKGEPQVRRTGYRPEQPRTRDLELDVPEFMPRR
jgi:hypothetical protein